MPTSLERFAARFHAEWLPKYCDARLERTPEGFRADTLERLDEDDAYWFLRAVDGGVVTETDGFFTAPLSRATEQLISTGPKDVRPRPLYLWTEPIMTIGAVGRLHYEFGWPGAQIGMQSAGYAFDFMCCDPALDRMMIAGEVKKSRRELERFLGLVADFGRQAPLAAEPPKEQATMRNAYKKVLGLRAERPALFWALGPSGYGRVCRVVHAPASDLFELETAETSALRCPHKVLGSPEAVHVC